MSDSLLPYAVGAAKRARQAAVRMRRRVERLQTAPAFASGIRPRPALHAVHLSVLGGRTLNVALTAPAAVDVTSAHLELTRGGRHLRLDLEVEPQSDGSRLLTATTALRYTDRTDLADHPEEHGPGRAGVALFSGLWRIGVVLTGADGKELRAGVGAVALPTTDGPTAPVSPSPDSGAHFRIMRSVDGFAVLKVRAPVHQAELDRFDLRWDRIVVHGRLIARQGPVSGYTAQAVRRGGGTVVPTPLEWDGDAFTFEVPLAEMVAGGRSYRWDMQLQHGRTGLKIGRRLTDVRRRHQVIRTTFRIIALEDGTLLRAHAYITSAGALAVSCVAFEGAPHGAEEVA
ncbi:hypothetical protein [Streptomyces omiyaensis]|uniref:Uncharacterized protein n=1 Tax=Streptomyces omiyaensis TaxID=68247 RepID=A0ABW7BJF4_9ACTN|nr:hypothetical protein [Streptomyces omiyaensis]GGY31120.1 hypothetical protein GCM10010363_09970 [Streptomyces omiyaensis]